MRTVTTTDEEVRAAVSMSDAIAAARQAFRDLAARRFEMPTRTVLRDDPVPRHVRGSPTDTVCDREDA